VAVAAAIVVPLSAAAANVLFTDSFDSGTTSAWSGTTQTGSSSTARVTSAAAQTGAGGLDTAKLGSNDNGRAEVFKTVNAPSTSVTSVQTSLRVVSRAGSGGLYLQRLYHAAPIYKPVAAIHHNGSAYELQMRSRNGTLTETPLNTQFALGVWYQVELVYDWSGAQPGARVYVNRQLDASMTDTTSGTLYAPDSAYLGLWEDSWSQRAEVQWDNVSVADGVQSGSGGASVVPTSTPVPATSTPLPATSTPTRTAVPATATPTLVPSPTAAPTQPSSGQGPLRRVNVPFFNSTVDASQAGVFWFGQVAPNTAYADVRMGYTPTELYALVTVIDRQLWYQQGLTSPSPNMTSYDSATLLLNLAGQNASTLGSRSYRFDAELNWTEPSRAGYQTAYVGNGTTWSASNVAFTTSAGWRGDTGPNSGVDAKGWVVTYHIPYSSLGLTGPPAQNTIWGLGMQVHNRDDAAGTAIADQVWPSGLNATNPTSWGQLNFGLPGYTPPAIQQTGSTTIAHMLNGANVPDGAVGGYADCGGAAASVNYFPTWGSLNYNGKGDFNVQNESDVSDWPCFSKYYITFPLSSVPAGKTILGAQLILHQFGNSETPDTSLDQVYSVDQAWSPATITWNNAPLARENVSQAPVGPLSSTPPWPGVARQFDLSYAVAQAYAAGQSSLMLAIYSPDTNYDSGKYFVSSETGDWNAAGRPTLLITWGG
jgi:hypothetical protein